jgi:hypothetical protein
VFVVMFDENIEKLVIFEDKKISVDILDEYIE